MRLVDTIDECDHATISVVQEQLVLPGRGGTPRSQVGMTFE
jgi:hypothetical protein